MTTNRIGEFGFQCIDCGRSTEPGTLARCPGCFGRFVERQAGATLEILLRQLHYPDEVAAFKRDAYFSPGLRPPPVKWVNQLTPFPGSRAKTERQRWTTIEDGQREFDQLSTRDEPIVGFMALLLASDRVLR